MADAGRDIMLLAGQLAARGETRRIRPLLDRLGQFGFNAEVVCLSAEGLEDAGPGILACPWLRRRWPRSWAVRRLCRGDTIRRPELIHVFHPEMGTAGLALAERWRIPYVQTVDEFLPEGGRLRVSRRWCRRLLVPGRGLADDLVRNVGVPPRLLTVVPPGVPIPESDALTTERAPVAVIGAAGPLVVGSGLTTFLNAARRVIDEGIDAEFVVAGQGPGETDLRRRAERLRIADRVTFTGDTSPEGPFWKVLDVFCLTALVPTTGRALGTALAHGVPSIATDVEGLSTWLTDDTAGLRVPPGDTDALSAAILEFLADPARARTHGRAGRERIAEYFHPDREAEDLAAVYRKVLDADPEPAGPHARAPAIPALDA